MWQSCQSIDTKLNSQGMKPNCSKLKEERREQEER